MFKFMILVDLRVETGMVVLVVWVGTLLGEGGHGVVLVVVETVGKFRRDTVAVAGILALLVRTSAGDGWGSTSYGIGVVEVVT